MRYFSVQPLLPIPNNNSPLDLLAQGAVEPANPCAPNSLTL